MSTAIPGSRGGQGLQGIQGVPGPQGIQGPPGPGLKSFRATGVTDGSGNVVFNMAAAAFAAAPVISLAYQGAASASPVDFRITALTTTSCTVNVRQSLATVVALIGLTILAASAPLAGATIHLHALEAGSQA